MLQHLSIQNYALIDKIDVDFVNDLTVITGETGAGKSILLGALGLITGKRADTKSLQDKSKKCVVEAAFNIKEYKLGDFFERNDLDYEPETIIRREISPNGKSRAFVNDTPVSLNQLKDLGERLIDIHSQHNTLTLNGSEIQLSIVDLYAQHKDLLSDYEKQFDQLRFLEKELNKLLEKEAQAKKDQDYFQFQFDELDDANLKENEQNILESELETLNHAEDIKRTLSKVKNGLDESEHSILPILNEIKSNILSLAKYNKEIKEVGERIKSSYIELSDICSELEGIEESIIYDPSKIELLTDRLDTLNRLQQKHQVNSVEELIEIKKQISEKLLEFNSLDSEIKKLKSELDSIKKTVEKSADTISKNRQKVLPEIEKEVMTSLASLAMENARLKIEQTQTSMLTSSGKDKIAFLFNANKGGQLQELSKVASGGELSRLMLSIKSILAKHTSLPSIIFDEIDTGVSGDVADKVGTIMTEMAKTMQVITITHLPQIASKGNSHLMVYKSINNNKTYSSIKQLKGEDRVLEIAKMLSTDSPTPSAIKNAKELLKT